MFPDVDWKKNPSLLFSDALTETGSEPSLDFKGMFDESVHAPPCTTTGTSVTTNVGITTHSVKHRKLFYFSDHDDFVQETQLVPNPATADTQILESQDTILGTQIGNPAAADTHITETQIGAKRILESQDKVPETQIGDPHILE